MFLAIKGPVSLPLPTFALVSLYHGLHELPVCWVTVPSDSSTDQVCKTTVGRKAPELCLTRQTMLGSAHRHPHPRHILGIRFFKTTFKCNFITYKSCCPQAWLIEAVGPML